MVYRNFRGVIQGVYLKWQSILLLWQWRLVGRSLYARQWFPRDRFGYSLIAVEVTPDNQIASITSRWNTCAGDTGDFITVDELKSILGTENYNNLLCKPTEITIFAQKFPKMNKLEYPEVSLYKLRLLSKGDVSLIVTRQDDNEHFYNISFDKIGNYYSLEEAEEALKTHKETDNDVISYQIIGPEHGHGDSTFVESEIDGIPDEIFETENYDESPEFQMIFDANRKFISSYFYDANNPGGARLEHEISFNIGDKA